MSRLHIVQGGISNGDKVWLEGAARRKLRSASWIVPKSANIGDDVVIYISGYGFFATAKVDSPTKRRTNWKNRYGAGLNSIILIQPAVSLASIKRHVPKLTWAKYPRSVTSPSNDIAREIRTLISRRRRTQIPDLDDDALLEANMDELRRVALLSARHITAKRTRKAVYRARSQAIRLYVLSRANGHCEACGSVAPFRKDDGRPYLEPHHTTRLADDGPDHPAKVIGLCPNCHRRAHYSYDSLAFNRSLKKMLINLERKETIRK
jgi:5-methylcytosine-specific restriction endonuclease McrA